MSITSTLTVHTKFEFRVSRFEATAEEDMNRWRIEIKFEFPVIRLWTTFKQLVNISSTLDKKTYTIESPTGLKKGQKLSIGIICAYLSRYNHIKKFVSVKFNDTEISFIAYIMTDTYDMAVLLEMISFIAAPIIAQSNLESMVDKKDLQQSKKDKEK